jgi:hypothetical protein
MTRSLLILAASLIIVPAAWAMDAPIQEGGGNSVAHAFTAAAPADTPSAAPSRGQGMPAFNPTAYGDASDCMTAAAAAHQPLGQCEGQRK